MITKATARRRAHKGAMFLDETLGRGWRRKIRRRKLDQSQALMNTGCGCVLAQLYGSYGRGTQEVGIQGAKQVQFGFLTYEPGAYPKLTEAWLEELRNG